MSQLEIGQEYPASNEAQYIQSLVETLTAQIQKDYPTGIMRRDAHPKQHGVVHAEFIIEQSLPENLRVGVFKEAKTYPCWVRFSNSGGTGGIHPDKNPDVRGMAIKLIGVEGEKILPEESNEVTQDFLVASYPNFIVKNAIDFSVLAAGLGKKDYLKLFLFFFNPFHLRLRELMLLIKSQGKCANVLGQRYWSMVASQLGAGQAVKYSAIPRSKVDNTLPTTPSDNFLRDRLKAHLSDQEATFDFCVQLQTNPDTMPIEDARVEWKESESPFIKVATIRIPPQSFDSEAQESFGENLSYTPWHSLPEHRPLGGINRARKVVYEAISEFRHRLNGVERREPKVMKPFEK
ncbi:MAG: catalase family protein [Aggregatilineales bacterium]